MAAAIGQELRKAMVQKMQRVPTFVSTDDGQSTLNHSATKENVEINASESAQTDIDM